MKSITQVVEDLIKPYIDSHDRAAEAIIAPVETDATSASDDYAVGKQLILNNVLYDVIAPITTGGALVVNTNIKAADKVSSDIEALTNKLNNEIVTRSELGAKNLLPYDIQKIKALNTAGTWNGNTYTPNNSSLNITLNTDGSITVDGTSASAATATLYIYGSASEANENIFKGMIASGCPSGGATNKYSLAIQGFSTTTPSGGNNYHDIGEGITVGNDNYVRVYVRIQNNTTVSNLTFKPMIRLASDPDATYQPYAKTNQELTAENQTLTQNVNNAFDVMSKNGAKNLLPISLETYKKVNSGFTWNANVATINGLTITFNEDGTFVINNTSSNWLSIRLISDTKGSDLQWLNGKKISGITTGSTSTYLLRVSKTTAPWTVYGRVTTEESIISDIPNNDDLVTVDMYIFSGQTFNNLKVKPMVTLASDINGNYEPYAMTNQELTPIAQAVSNRNLLDNPWFTVNQRGFSSKNDNGFTVDRWEILQAAGTVSLSDGVITINPTESGTVLLWGQTIEDALTRFAGKTLTLSVLLSDGTIKSKVFEYPTSVPSNTQVANVYLGSTHYFEIYAYTSGHARCGYFNDGGVIPSAPITIKAVKLELGSASTLAQDTAPNYQQELAKCQRYFVRFKPSSGYAWIGIGIGEGSTTLQVLIDLPTVMRANPTISYADIGVWSSSESGMLSSIASDGVTGNKIHATITADASFTAGRAVCLWLNSALNAYVDFSADL